MGNKRGHPAFVGCIHWLDRFPGWVTGILIDMRGRYSLTHLQLALWTILILSLISGVFFGRLQHGVSDPLNFTIPPEVLGLLGHQCWLGGDLLSSKGSDEYGRAARVIAGSGVGPWRPSLMQFFQQEEGTYADQVVDIGKFQGFTITIVLVVAYTALTIDSIHKAATAADLTSLPTFAGTFLVLLGISQGTYACRGSEAARAPPRD